MNFIKILSQPVDRTTYAITGFSLMALKFIIDFLVARFFFEKTWSPIDYIIWPNGNATVLLRMGEDERIFGLTMLAISIPFIIIGTTMTFQRLKSACLPPILVLLFFVPVVNLFLIGILCVRIPKQPSPELADLTPVPETPKPGILYLFGATFLSALLTVCMVVLGANLLANYGFALFIGAPFAHGFFSVLIYGWKTPQPFWRCISIGLQSTILAGCLLFFFGIEGAICLLMFLPLGLILALLGCCFGYMVQARPWLQKSFPSIILMPLAGLPFVMGMESNFEPASMLRQVDSSIIIQAEPATVWDVVVAFPPIPDDNLPWYFRTGVAYPVRAEIHGDGVGAVRKCVFSTGPFIEPITRWEKPHRLSFDVIDQPCPMHELSPYKIHPPHLENYLRSQKGEFRLVDLGNGTTLLEGTTWYKNRMWPQEYWGQWSDAIIHQVHLRVLDHIRQHAEASRKTS